MAKSVRASVSKRNRANLRKKVFGPVVDARTERLAAKLQEIASQPKPEAPKKPEMEVDSDEAGTYAALSRLGILTHLLRSLSRTTPPGREDYPGQRK